MPFTLNGKPLSSATIEVPRHDRWAGVVSVATLSGGLKLADGAAVELVLGDMTLRGHKVAGGDFEGEGETGFAIAAGSGGWAKSVPAQSWAIAGGVKLSLVAAALAKSVGEKIEIGTDRVLGDHWTQSAGVASSALSLLFPLDRGGWRVDPDGVTRPGVRPPAPLPPGAQIILEGYDPAMRKARLSLTDNKVSALLPGAIITGPTLTAPIVVRTSTIHVAAESVSIEVLGEDGVVELFAALVQALTAPRLFDRQLTYQVETDPGSPTLKPSTLGLSTQSAVDKIPGVPGVTSTLAKDALVLVGFRDGDPARPFIAGYVAGVLPIDVGIEASAEIDLTAPLLKLVGQVELGGGTPEPLTKFTALNTWATAVSSALTAAGHPVTPLAGAATTNVKGS